MNALIYTNEYPPCNYGGAGVHVEYLTRELAKLPDVDVDVRAFGDQKAEEDYPLKVKGYPSTRLISMHLHIYTPSSVVRNAQSATMPMATRPTSCTVIHGIPTSPVS